MSYDTKAERRWELKYGASGKPDANEKLSFIAQMEDYDVLYDERNECYTVVKERSKDSGSYNFTDYFLTTEGTLEPTDSDVPLDPYHMCLLYQLHEEVGHTLTL